MKNKGVEVNCCLKVGRNTHYSHARHGEKERRDNYDQSEYLT